ncbi:SRPBCC family protein [Streptomyces sp. NBC_01803]|uniref:SRPBCC family protein n=1 Tax=Streptomyces sp. NBC_01803 TaxID=2975946 RepID=UPI002DD94F57|nr:SRPBCC family protein [Streptomyces sp. NBC_01803]WSA46344.1 SRPBCC family protein [Streptomyces sp. NBC_01803]
MPFKDPVATGRVTVNVTPAEAYRVVSDPLLMVTFAEETVEARWLRGATHATVGARFRGVNRNGRRRWVTTCTITETNRNRRFAYEVATAPLRIPVSLWRYDIDPVPDGTGCVITESNWIRVPRWFRPITTVLTGVSDRVGANRAHIATTLDRLKSHLESRQPA